MASSSQKAKDLIRWRAEWHARMDDPAERQRNRTRKRLRDLIYNGHVTRGSCAVCGKPQGQAHHPDYSRPFWIVWLCPRHHARLHIDIGRGDLDAAAKVECLAVEVPRPKPRTAWTEALKRQLRELCEAGTSTLAIADALGISYGSAATMKKRLRLTAPRKKAA